MNRELCNRILSHVDQISWSQYDYTQVSTGARFYYEYYSLHPRKFVGYGEILFFVENAFPQYENRAIGSIRINKYTSTAHIDRHRDNSDPQRKHTLLVQLSDPTTYEGGDLIIDDQVVSREQGSYFLFNSQTTWHHVNPVIRGIRYSLVVWAYKNEEK